MDKDYSSYLLAMLTICVALIINVVLSGWVITILWGWFIVPLFGIAVPSIVAAIGLTFTLRVILGTRDNSNENDSKKSLTDIVIASFARAILLPLLYLGFGWLIHLYMG